MRLSVPFVCHLFFTSLVWWHQEYFLTEIDPFAFNHRVASVRFSWENKNVCLLSYYTDPPASDYLIS